MVFDTTEISKGDVIFDHKLKRAVVPTVQYIAESVRLIDNHDSVIELYTADIKNNTRREFHVGRDIPNGEKLRAE
jgi:hypothetical protein